MQQSILSLITDQSQTKQEQKMILKKLEKGWLGYSRLSLKKR